jgi:hypothetical protein
MKPKESISGTLAFAAVVGAVSGARSFAQSVVHGQSLWRRLLPNFWVTGVVMGPVSGADHILMVTQGFQTGGLASPGRRRRCEYHRRHRLDQSVQGGAARDRNRPERLLFNSW